LVTPLSSSVIGVVAHQRFDGSICLLGNTLILLSHYCRCTFVRVSSAIRTGNGAILYI
jgi:hypothetical protein